MNEGTTIIDTLIGLGMPVLIALINQAHWSPKLRGAVAFASCVAAATVIEWVRGDADWADWRTTLVVVLGAALVSYQTFWKPSMIAPTIEAVTTIGGAPMPDSEDPAD